MKVFVPFSFGANVKSVDPVNHEVKVTLTLPQRPEGISGLQPEDCGANVNSLASQASETSCQPETIDRRALYHRHNDGDVVDRKIMITGVNVAWDGNIGGYEQSYELQPGSEIEIKGGFLDMRVLKSENRLSSENGPWQDLSFTSIDANEALFTVPQPPYNPAFADEDDLATLKLYFYGEKLKP